MAREVQRSMPPIPDPPSSDYPGDTSKFNGKIDLVQINLEAPPTTTT